MNVEAVLVDLSGTLFVEDEVVSNAPEAINRLRERGVPIRFVTNTTKESKRIIFERLQRMKFQVDKNEIFTSLSAAREFVHTRKLRPMLFLEEEAKEDFQGLNLEHPNAVVVGLSPENFHYEQLNKAFRLLLDGAQLIAIHKSRYYKKKDGLWLGPGPFVSALEFAADIKAEVVGKPERSFFLQAVHDTGADPSRVVMIGDDAKDDIAGAMNAGMMGILVKTGKYREGDENKITSKPTALCTDIAEAINFVLQTLMNN